MRKCSNRARSFSYAHRFGGVFESSLLSQNFIVKKCELQPERCGLGVDPVRSTYNDSRLELLGALLQDIEQPLKIFENNLGGVPYLQRERCIQHVGRRETKMKKTGCRANVLGHRRRKGDHIMLYFRFDCINAVY